MAGLGDSATTAPKMLCPDGTAAAPLTPSLERATHLLGPNPDETATTAVPCLREDTAAPQASAPQASPRKGHCSVGAWPRTDKLHLRPAQNKWTCSCSPTATLLISHIVFSPAPAVVSLVVLWGLCYALVWFVLFLWVLSYSGVYDVLRPLVPNLLSVWCFVLSCQIPFCFPSIYYISVAPSVPVQVVLPSVRPLLVSVSV